MIQIKRTTVDTLFQALDTLRPAITTVGNHHQIKYKQVVFKVPLSPQASHRKGNMR